MGNNLPLKCSRIGQTRSCSYVEDVDPKVLRYVACERLEQSERLLRQKLVTNAIACIPGQMTCHSSALASLQCGKNQQATVETDSTISGGSTGLHYPVRTIQKSWVDMLAHHFKGG